MRARSRSLIEIHLAVFLFGFPGLFGKWLALSPPSLFPVFTVFLEPFLTRERWDPASHVFALLCVLGIGLIIPRFDLVDTVVRGVLWGLGAGLTFSVLTILNRVLALRQSSLAVAFQARAASILSSLEPVYGILLALLFLKESPSLRTVSGGAVVLAAALVATVRARRTS